MTRVVSPPFATDDDLREAMFGYCSPPNADFIGFKGLRVLAHI